MVRARHAESRYAIHDLPMAPGTHGKRRVDDVTTEKSIAPRDQKRMAAGPRREHLLDAAARQIVVQGFLPLPIEGLARSAQVSKALIYVHFPTQYDLANAILAREIDALFVAGLDEASRGDSLEKVAVDCATIYFEHVRRWGPLLHIILSDLYMAHRHDRETMRRRDAVMRRLVRLVRRDIRLPVEEVIAGLNIILAIPEEAGALAFLGEIDPPLARDMCRTLTVSALKGLAANAKR
jgi:AcrR family transcriptional regulator